MISKVKNQNKSISAFTLIEMVIVLVIMGILLMVTMYLSGDQIQRVKDKTVKESILAERQSRYSRNLGSSSFAGNMYKYLDISLSGGDNKIIFDYIPKDDGQQINNIFTDNFVIEKIITNPEEPSNHEVTDTITFRYTPYQIPCEWGKNNNGELDTNGMLNKLLFVARVNDNRNYCFEIDRKNCRLMEVSRERCNIEEFLLNNQ